MCNEVTILQIIIKDEKAFRYYGRWITMLGARSNRIYTTVFGPRVKTSINVITFLQNILFQVYCLRSCGAHSLLSNLPPPHFVVFIVLEFVSNIFCVRLCFKQTLISTLCSTMNSNSIRPCFDHDFDYVSKL